MRRLHAGRVSFAAALFAVLFAIQFGLGSMLSRFEGDPLEDLRFALNRTTFSTVLDTLPFGTGLGSFVRVYATVEKQQDVFTGFANRAHDDLAELLLETGFIGACLLLAFVAWYAMRSFRVWRTRETHGDAIEPMLERAASLIIGLLLLHSLVDYPLRTAALGAVFAFFCAILAVPAPADHERRKAAASPGKAQGPGKTSPKSGAGRPAGPKAGSAKNPKTYGTKAKVLRQFCNIAQAKSSPTLVLKRIGILPIF